MKFQDFIYHIEGLGCNIDRINEDSHMATNCINAAFCEIEDLKKFKSDSIVHYCYELHISAPEWLSEKLEIYTQIREALDKMEKSPVEIK